jgi:hypothetical protein
MDCVSAKLKESTRKFRTKDRWAAIRISIVA